MPASWLPLLTALCIVPVHPPAHPLHRSWSVTVRPADPMLVRLAKAHASGATGIAVAGNLLAAIRGGGYPMVHATVNLAVHQIDIQVARFPASGKLSTYLPAGKLVTVARLRSALPLLSAVAVSRHERVNLGLDAATMTLDPSLSGARGRPYGGGLVLSSYGPRYAGSAVASSYAYAHRAGYDISGSITRGLPDWTPKQSGGGAYVGENIAVDHPTPEGIFGIHFSHAHFTAGGGLRPLKLRGYVTQISGGDRYPLLDGSLWVRGGLTFASERQRLGALGWGTDQSNLSAYAGLSGSMVWRATSINIRATIFHGLAGSSSSLSKSPNLMGRWSAGYSTERFRVSARRRVGPVALHGILGAQHGSPGTPQIMQAYIGGLHRGSSFFTGSYSGPSGVWYAATIEKAAPIRLARGSVFFSGVRPFATINGGTVFAAAGPARSVASLGVGLRFRLARRLAGQIGYSRTIERPAESRQDAMLNFQIVSNF